MTIAAIQKTIEGVIPVAVKGVGTVLSAAVLCTEALGLSMKDKIVASALLGATTWLLAEEIERLTAKKVYSEALRVFGAGDLDKAKTMAETALAYREAHTLLGRIYLQHGNSVQGEEHLREAAGQGSSEALYRLGLRMEETKKTHAAFELYTKAAREHNKDAALAVALCYSRGIGTIQDDDEAFYWFRRACSDGSQEASYYLYRAYSQGKGVFRSDSLATFYFAKAVAGKSGDTVFKMACAMKDYALYKYAAELGHAEAGCVYGTHLYQTDQKAGFLVLRTAAMNGSLSAALQCGALLDAHDADLATYWYEQASKLVQNSARQLYAIGLLLDKNDKKERALQFFHRAADLGFPNAMFKVAISYLVRDRAEALSHIQIAATNGCQEALDWLQSNGPTSPTPF